MTTYLHSDDLILPSDMDIAVMPHDQALAARVG